MTATALAEAARAIAREAGLRVRVFDRAACEKMGMGAFLGVNRGSVEPPQFIHLAYVPRGTARRRIALIGKGITFDSGGLDLKTAEGMERMKGDMSGAAAVLGVLKVLPRIRPPVEVHGLVAATDNMPSGSATKPGDVLRAMSGKTIEVNNTDAEGRLTLADAIAYARQEVKPDEIVDIATLTGAVSIALGSLCAGAMSNDAALQRRVLAAAGAGRGAPLAAAPDRRVPRGAPKRGRGPPQHRPPPRRRDHGRPLHPRVRGEHPVGPPGHRGRRLHRQGPAVRSEGRRRVRGADPARVRARRRPGAEGRSARPKAEK